MADIPLRVRRRDKFKQKLGLNRSAPVEALKQSPRSGTSSIVTLPTGSGTSSYTTPNTVSSNLNVAGSNASNIAIPETRALGAGDRVLEPAGAATPSSANADNVPSPASATPDLVNPKNSSQAITPPSTIKPQTRDLWADALQKLSSDDQEAIQQLRPSSNAQQPPSEIMKELLGLTTKVEKECKAKSFKFRFRDKEIILRDVVGKTVFWLNKFKDVGDIAMNFDPVHASLPWAGVRFLLQAAIAEHEQMGDLVVATEKLSCLISRGAIYERLYRHGVLPDDIVANLHHALIQLYAETLRMLGLCYRMFVKNTAKRAVHAIFKPGDVSELLEKCEKLEMQVEYEAHNCERARSQEADEESKKLLEILKEPILRIDQNVLNLLEKGNEKERLEVLDWLSTVLYGLNHLTVREERTADTCGWLLKHSQYQEWQDTSASIIFWLSGTAGTGKTFLTSKAIDDIQGSLNSNSNQEGFAFFYCNRNEAERREPLSMLRAFVRQLSTPSSEKHSIQKRLKAYYNDCRLKASQPTMKDCKELLLELVNIYPRTTLVIDALDECEKHKRLELIETLDYILAQASNPVKIFISSRPDGDIKERLKDRANIEIDANKNQDDISRFVNSEIVKHRRWRNMPPKLQTQIVETLQQQSQGMFQWAYLQIKQLLDLNRPTEIERRLGKLPEDLKHAYDEIYNGISKHEKEIADRAFQWVMCARHPLTTSELLPAICQEENSDALLPLDGLDEDLILEYCHNLLIIDPVREVWIPSHLSVIEYFENHLWRQIEANFLVLRVSLLVLQNTVLYNREEKWALKDEVSTEEESSSEAESSIDMESNPKGYPRDSSGCSPSVVSIAAYDPLPGNEFRDFRYYARHHWMIHAVKSAGIENNECLSTILNLFLGQPTNSSPAYRCWLSMVIKDKDCDTSIFETASVEPEYFRRFSKVKKFEDCSVAGFAYCAFDLACVLPNWYDFSWIDGEKTEKNQSYLELAALFGATYTCRELIKHGAEVNEQTGSDYGSALAAAILWGRREVVEYLVKDGAEANLQLQCGRYGSALAAAACAGESEIVEYLVKGGAEANLQLQCGRYGSALAAAACAGESEIVEYLVKGGAEANLQLQCGGYGSALAAAACAGESEIVEYLVKGGAEVNLQLQCGRYGSALAAAAYWGEREIVEYLIEGGAEVNLQLQYGEYANALEASEKSPWDETLLVVELLVELGAKKQARESGTEEESDSER
ncbi:hypothetical protein N431DRAFT_477640 [Stipitochalara longipes BDJ]|nr:hypothetical protein N431DRAFT_477640 [Stipitochalara longipes BDJ]